MVSVVRGCARNVYADRECLCRQGRFMQTGQVYTDWGVRVAELANWFSRMCAADEKLKNKHGN